jgi:DnaK suppressor protein
MKRVIAQREKRSNESYRRMLLDKRTDLLSSLGVKFDTVALMGRVAEEDQAQVHHEEFISLSLNSLDYRQLGLVEEALDRLRAGDYGVCLTCGDPIAVKRLKAVPWARYCISCQERAGNLLLDPASERTEITAGQ